MKTDLVHSIDQHAVNLQLLQDRVETNANMLVERLYNQVQVYQDTPVHYVALIAFSFLLHRTSRSHLSNT